jgi:hypothetical protein
MVSSLAQVFAILNQMREGGSSRGTPSAARPPCCSTPSLHVRCGRVRARVHDYDGVPVHVVDPEHLVALALEAGGARRRERAWLLVESGAVDRVRLRDLLARYGIDAVVPDDV